eukprot:scpid54419/ scgid6884/ 
MLTMVFSMDVSLECGSKAAILLCCFRPRRFSGSVSFRACLASDPDSLVTRGSGPSADLLLTGLAIPCHAGCVHYTGVLSLSHIIAPNNTTREAFGKGVT